MRDDIAVSLLPALTANFAPRLAVATVLSPGWFQVGWCKAGATAVAAEYRRRQGFAILHGQRTH